MADAKRDNNRIPTLLAVSSTDGTTPVTLYADPTTHRLYVDLTAGGTTTVDVNPTTITLGSLESADVTNTGDTTNAVFQFSIPKGSTMYSTVTIPSNAIGENGDWAFSTAVTSEVFYKSAGVWSLVNSIRGATGATGAAGPTGPAGLVWHGTYDAGHPYVVNDGVAYNGTSYICIQNGTGQTPDPAGTAYWQVLALKGTNGAGSGDVLGPASNTADYLPQWDGANSKTLKNGLAVPAGGLAGITALGTKTIALTPVALQTSNYSANANELVPCNIGGGTFTVTLPNAPADGSRVQVEIVNIGTGIVPTPGVFLIVSTSGADTFQLATVGPTTIYMSLSGENIVAQYVASTKVWIFTTSSLSANFATNFTGIDTQTPITNADISLNYTTRVLTVTPPLGFFNFFVDGNGKITRFRKGTTTFGDGSGTSGNNTWTDTSGMWYFYFNSAGQPVTTQTAWTIDDFSTTAPVYRLLWNKTLFKFTVTAATAAKGDTYTNNSSTFTVLESISGGTTLKCTRTTGTNNPDASGNLARATGAGTNPIVFSAFSEDIKSIAEYIEYHLNDIPADTHAWFHLQGTQWSKGFVQTSAIGGTTPATNGSGTVISLSTGTNIDDNLEYTVTNSTAGTAWTQDMGATTTPDNTNGGQFQIFSQNAGGLVTFIPASRFPFAFNATTNFLEYVSSTGVQTTVTSTNFVTLFLYATQNPRAGEPVKVVMYPGQFTGTTNARAINWIDIQNTYSILNEGEIRPLYRLIYEHRTTWNAGNKFAALREVQDLRKAAITSSATATGSIPASSVTLVTPVGMAATNAQSGFDELQANKVKLTPVAVSTADMVELATGFTLAGGTTSKTLTVALDASVSGTNTGDNVAASTSVAGLAPQATAPASGLYNYLGITNGETAYTNKALFNATSPSTQAFGDSAVVGTSANAARQDHKHQMMAAPTTVSGTSGGLSGTPSITVNTVTTTGNIELGAATDCTIARSGAGAVTIEAVKIMTEGSADTVTGVKTLGTTGAIKLGSAVTDKCEIRLNDSALNDETWSGTVIDAVAGATIAVGDACYLKTADGQWYLNDGILDGTDTGFKLKLGICVLAANDNGATKILLDGVIASAAFPSFTVGAPVYLDDTAGDLVVAQPTTTNFAIRVVGEAVSATVLHFHPSNDYGVHI